MRFPTRLGLLVLAVPAALCATAQNAPHSTATLVLPSGTPLSVRSDARVGMHTGTGIAGTLMYTVYANNAEVLPAGTRVTGHIVSLAPAHAERISARMHGDFTPLHRAAVQFDSLMLPDGTVVPISTDATSDGAKVVRLTPPPHGSGSLLSRMWHQGVRSAKDQVAFFTAPGKADRLKQFVYSQLPYHPESIAGGTTWNLSLTATVDLPANAATEAPATDRSASHKRIEVVSPSAKEPSPADADVWTIQAFLQEPLSSQTAHVGETIHAIVAEPVRNADGSIAVQQNAILQGTVTRAKPAKLFGRAGVLQFHFRELQEPGALTSETVQASLAGIDANGGHGNMSMDTEGNVKSNPPGKVLVPLLLFALASQPLDQDPGRSMVGKDAVASNSLGMAGFIAGTAGGWPNVAAGIGFYGMAISLYERWIRRGNETTFPRNTRVVVQTSARHSTPMEPQQ